ncbi:MAG: hypothetical protein JNJ46_06420 [Myxococcales bacterium]|nr:hypothetical protein [Myxococcales bacterium]
MYTVIRFLGGLDRLPMLMKTGTEMNAIRNGIYTGLRKRGDGFSCEICSDKSWQMHQTEILAFMGEFGSLIKQSVAAGASVTLDIAVEPEDIEEHRPILVLRHGSDLLSVLSSCGVALEVSIY